MILEPAFIVFPTQLARGPEQLNMLPASQMSSAMMPERQGCEPISIVARLERNGIGDSHRGCHTASQRQSSLIGISQPSQRVAHPVAHRIPLPEHNLRRKTPRGTVDAGYDGSHIQSILQSPLKQLILPMPFNLKMISCPNPTPVSLQHCNDWNHSTLPIAFDQALQTQASSLPYSWTVNDGPSTFDLGNSIQRFMVEYPRSKQPVIRAHDHNVPMFCPPPPSSGSLVLGQPVWHTGNTPWIYRDHDQTRSPGPGFVSQGGYQLLHGSLPSTCPNSQWTS